MKNVLLAVVAALAVSGADRAAAQAVTGNTLLQRVAADKRVEDGRGSTGDFLDSGWLIGFALGVASTLQIVDPRTCLPQGGTVGQLVRVIIQYLEANPAELHKEASGLAIAAFRKAFPCPIK